MFELVNEEGTHYIPFAAVDKVIVNDLNLTVIVGSERHQLKDRSAASNLSQLEQFKEWANRTEKPMYVVSVSGHKT